MKIVLILVLLFHYQNLYADNGNFEIKYHPDGERYGLEVELPPDLFEYVSSLFDFNLIQKAFENLVIEKGRYLDIKYLLSNTDNSMPIVPIRCGPDFFDQAITSEEDLNILPKSLKATLLDNLPETTKPSAFAFLWGNKPKTRLQIIQERWAKLDFATKYHSLNWEDLNPKYKTSLFYLFLVVGVPYKELLMSHPTQYLKDLSTVKSPKLRKLWQLWSHMNLFRDQDALEMNYRLDHIVNDPHQLINDLLLIADVVGKTDELLHPSKVKDASKRLSWHGHTSRSADISPTQLGLMEDYEMLHWLQLEMPDILIKGFGYSGRPEIRGLNAYGRDVLNGSFESSDRKRHEKRQHSFDLNKEIAWDNYLLSIPDAEAIAVLRRENQKIITDEVLETLAHELPPIVFFYFMTRNQILTLRSHKLNFLAEVLKKNPEEASIFLNDWLFADPKTNFKGKLEFENKTSDEILYWIKKLAEITRGYRIKYDSGLYPDLISIRAKVNSADKDFFESEFARNIEKAANNDNYWIYFFLAYDRFSKDEKNRALDLILNSVHEQPDAFTLQKTLLLNFLNERNFEFTKKIITQLTEKSTVLELTNLSEPVLEVLSWFSKTVLTSRSQISNSTRLMKKLNLEEFNLLKMVLKQWIDQFVDWEYYQMPNLDESAFEQFFIGIYDDRFTKANFEEWASKNMDSVFSELSHRNAKNQKLVSEFIDEAIANTDYTDDGNVTDTARYKTYMKFLKDQRTDVRIGALIYFKQLLFKPNSDNEPKFLDFFKRLLPRSNLGNENKILDFFNANYSYSIFDELETWQIESSDPSVTIMCETIF